MMVRRNYLAYGVLIAIWLLIAGWQIVEHLRVREASRTLVINRARDITSTLALVMRSQRRFGVISRERLESALEELIRRGEVNSILLLSAEGEIVASSGEEFDFPSTDAVAGVHWSANSVTVVNLVDLGSSVSQETEPRPPTLVLPRDQMFTNFSVLPPPPPRPPRSEVPELVETDSTNSARVASRTSSRTSSSWRSGNSSTNRPSFSRPFWMGEEEYRAAIKRQGVHSFAIVMSSETMHRLNRQDLWLRTLITLLAGAVAGVSGFAWRNMVKTSDLQIRLIKASEMNSHLKEMNLAAAGLAHETRNPLNIIRGLAQLISKEPDLSSEIRRKSSDITDEADRVTAQLNEFINYSRPREVRRAPVALGAVVGEVVRALDFDVEEKSILLQVCDENLVVEADEQLLRQTLFNLLLNAIQAAEPKGEIQVVAFKSGPDEAVLEIRDNGPGVPPSQRTEIFKPYVTSHQKGTGLGLAVVQQIVSAHGWEIVCLGNEPKGAIFRIRHLRLCRTT